MDYFGLKNFSYYPRDYERADFDADVAASEVALLPFRSLQASAAIHLVFPDGAHCELPSRS